jgi:hypothetical protein
MRSKHVTIFEGPDGSGKTTAAKQYAYTTGARYVHLPSLPRVTDGLARMYVEAMLPAILGYQPVVLDRCWLSETPYGEVFREGRDRMSLAARRMLERLALRCGAVVVRCDPGLDSVLESFRKRKGLEMLKSEIQLQRVYDLYVTTPSELPIVHYDFGGYTFTWVQQEIARQRLPCHPVDLLSAGNWHAPFVLMGEEFAERKNQDPWYQWPFASFSSEGCSKWLTDELHRAGVREQGLLWVNADQDLEQLDTRHKPTFIALGRVAGEKLASFNIKHSLVEHPQYHKRFKSGQIYPLINHIVDVAGD